MKCPICNSSSCLKFTSHLNKKIFLCSNIKCEHLFEENFSSSLGVCDRGTDLSLAKLKADRDERIRKYDERNKSVFKAIFKKLALPNDCKILDFGSGDGNLMYSLKTVFPDTKITCIEPHNCFSELLKEVSDNIVPSAEKLSEKFDLIVLNEVIEHLNDPLKEMRALSDALNDNNAAIYIATPLGKTHFDSFNTSAYDTDSHLHFFTRKSLDLCLIKSGMTSLDTNTIDDPLYSTICTNSTKIRLKRWLINYLEGNFLRLSKRYCRLPTQHISGLCYKA